MKFATHSDIRSYEDTVVLAIESRTNRSVTGIEMVGLDTTISLDQTPTTGEVSDIDDIMAATERYQKSTSGSQIVYELQPTDPTDSTLPDTHMTFNERISQLVGDTGSLGRNVGGVAPADVTPDTTGFTVTVTLPDGASDTAKARVETAMKAFGKVRV